MNIKDIITESQHKCPHCGGPVVEYSELGEGKKDACYYKVKASAKVWPSAYASGRLVQCRKKGASNYGNKSEGVEEAIRPIPVDDKGNKIKGLPPIDSPGKVGDPGSSKSSPKGVVTYTPTGLIHKSNRGDVTPRPRAVAEEQLDEKCWDGYQQQGMKNKGGRQVPNCVPAESVEEDLSRRGFLRGLGAAAAAGATGSAMAQSHTVDASRAFANMRKDDPLVQHNKDIDEMARAIYDQIITQRGQPMDRRQQQMWMTIAREKASEKLAKYAPGRPSTQPQRSGFPSQGSERRVSRNIDNFESVEQSVKEDLSEEFDLIESIINQIAEHNGVDAETVWADLESLTEDELYAFAVTSQLNEDWQKANKRDKTDGMSQKAVNAYRRENPGSKLKTAVTTKPSKLKKGGKASKRRKSYCSRSRGQMKMHNISCAKTPDKAICKARRRWNC